MSNGALKMQLRSVDNEAVTQIRILCDVAKAAGVDPHELRTADGTWPMVNLILARAQALNGLATLETK